MSPATSAVISGNNQIDANTSSTSGIGQPGLAHVAAEGTSLGAPLWQGQRHRRRSAGSATTAPRPRYVRFCETQLAQLPAVDGQQPASRHLRTTARSSGGRAARPRSAGRTAARGWRPRAPARGCRSPARPSVDRQRRRPPSSRRREAPISSPSTSRRCPPPPGDPQRAGAGRWCAAGSGRSDLREQLLERALEHGSRPRWMIATPVAQLLHLGHQVAGEQHRDALAGQPAHQLPHVAHAGRVEPGGRLVQHQQPRVGAAARRRSPAAGACRGSSRRPCRCARSASSTRSSTSSIRARASPPSSAASSSRFVRPVR